MIAAEQGVGGFLLLVDGGQAVEVHLGGGCGALDGLSGHVGIHLVHPPGAVGLVGVGGQVVQGVAHVPVGKAAAGAVVLQGGDVLDQACGIAQILMMGILVGADLIILQAGLVADAAHGGDVGVHGVVAAVGQAVQGHLIGGAVVLDAPGDPRAQEIHIVIGEAGAGEPGQGIHRADGLDEILPGGEPYVVGHVPGIGAVVGLVEDVVHAVAGQACLDAFFRHFAELPLVQGVVGGALEGALLIVPVGLDVRAAHLDPSAAGLQEGPGGQHGVGIGMLQTVRGLLLEGIGPDGGEQVGGGHVLLADAVEAAHGHVANLVVLLGEIRRERGPAVVVGG